MNKDQLRHAELLREAFNAYLVLLYDSTPNSRERSLDYEFDFIEGRRWRGVSASMVKCDLRELTNLVNRWSFLLWRWRTWSLVLEGREELERWELSREFLDSIVHECLLFPSSMRDTITWVATSAFHQVRLNTEQTYRDHLEGEPETAEERAKPLNRRQKEKRLSRMLKIWPISNKFLKALAEINTTDYIKETSNYRNFTAHTIGPRIGIGHTRSVTRYLKQAQELKQVNDGTYVYEDLLGELTVSYSMGGMPPLDLETVFAANLVQYKKARSCYAEYRALLETAVGEIETLVSANTRVK